MSATDIASPPADERLRLLAQGRALEERLRELAHGDREVMRPRYYAVARLLAVQQEAVARGDAADWTTIQPTASALLEYNAIQSQMVCAMYHTIADYMALAETVLHVTQQDIEARADRLVEEWATRTAVIARPPLAQ